MKLIRDFKTQLKNTVITIGNFDGVHLAHQQLLSAAVQTAKKEKSSSVLLTFEPNPAEFFQTENKPARLMRFFEKWLAVKKYAIDYIYCARFNKKLSQMSAEDFVKKILVDQLGAKKIIVGDDFRFGAKRAGDMVLLKKLGDQYGFTVDALTQIQFQSDRISSSRVRLALKTGDFETASQLLGSPFCLSGRVSYGSQIGRTLGFPTANIHLHRKQVPLMGIFVVRVHGLNNKILNAVASIGYRPTFNGKQILLEVFIFDFDELIYGKRIRVEFLSKIRDELKFESVDELIERMNQDVLVAKKYFQNQ